LPFGSILTLGAVTALPKVIASVSQGQKAKNTKLQNSQPAAFLEKMALDRQAAATARLPGMSGQQTRLGQVQSGALQNARLGAASGSDFLGAASAGDSKRQAGEQQLAVSGLNYQDKSRQQLGADLTQQAAYQQHDLDTYNRTKAALTQSSAENANNAISGLASYGAAGINRSDNLSQLDANRPAGIAPAATTPSLATGFGTVLGQPYSAPFGVQSATKVATSDNDPNYLYGLRRRRYDTRLFGL
jgi:Spy/CpxP family protein refolding chaperone